MPHLLDDETNFHQLVRMTRKKCLTQNINKRLLFSCVVTAVGFAYASVSDPSSGSLMCVAVGAEDVRAVDDDGYVYAIPFL